MTNKEDMIKHNLIKEKMRKGLIVWDEGKKDKKKKPLKDYLKKGYRVVTHLSLKTAVIISPGESGKPFTIECYGDTKGGSKMLEYMEDKLINEDVLKSAVEWDKAYMICAEGEKIKTLKEYVESGHKILKSWSGLISVISVSEAMVAWGAVKESRCSVKEVLDYVNSKGGK